MDILDQIVDTDLGCGNRSEVDKWDIVKHGHFCKLVVFDHAVDIPTFIEQDREEVNSNFSRLDLFQFLVLDLPEEVDQCIAILTEYPVFFANQALEKFMEENLKWLILTKYPDSDELLKEISNAELYCFPCLSIKIWKLLISIGDSYGYWHHYLSLNPYKLGDQVNFALLK